MWVIESARNDDGRRVTSVCCEWQSASWHHWIWRIPAGTLKHSLPRLVTPPPPGAGARLNINHDINEPSHMLQQQDSLPLRAPYQFFTISSYTVCRRRSRLSVYLIAITYQQPFVRWTNNRTSRIVPMVATKVNASGVWCYRARQ